MKKIIILLLFLFILIDKVYFIHSFENQNENENENQYQDQIKNQKNNSFTNSDYWLERYLLKSSNPSNKSNFGNSVSISDDFIAVGSPYKTIGNSTSQGEVNIFKFNGTNWNNYQTIIASDGESNDLFGFSVDLYNNYLVIGAYEADVGNNTDQGKAYIFRNNGTQWNQEAILIASDGEAYGRFGFSVGIYNNSVIIGSFSPTLYENHIKNSAPNPNSNPKEKAYIFRNNGTQWNQEAILTSKDPQGSLFGYSVDIYENYSVVGEYGATVGSNMYQGKCYVFKFNGTNWNYDQVLFADDGNSYEEFGFSVSIYGDYIVSGAIYAKVYEIYSQGKAYIFYNNGTSWNQNCTLIASEGDEDEDFGNSVDIDQDNIIVGAYFADANDNSQQGKAYTYTRNGSEWIETGILIASDGESGDTFGTSVSISNDFAVIGAPKTNFDNLTFAGKAYIFEKLLIPDKVIIVNCTPLFSEFECCWEKKNLIYEKFQIKYDQEWINVGYQIEDTSTVCENFDGFFYPNITGNEFYSIQIRSCNLTYEICGEPSDKLNLTTQVDTVQDLNFISSTYYINISWTHPDVPIINSIPKLDHYMILYYLENDPSNISNISISNSSNSYILNGLKPVSNYSITIYGCISLECEGKDQGENITNTVTTSPGLIDNLECYVYNISNVNCTWTKSEYNQTTNYLVIYQSNLLDDFGNFTVIDISTNFTVKYSNMNYSISVSACDEYSNCGLENTEYISTNPLKAPSIRGTIGGIEEISIIFSKVEYSEGYIISIDNGINWNNLSELIINENSCEGRQTNIEGNEEQSVCIRACSENTCNEIVSGITSECENVTAKLGYLKTFECNKIKNGFKCNWETDNLTSGLKNFSLSYDSQEICLSPNERSYQDTNLSGKEYTITIFESAGVNCSYSSYSGPSSSREVSTENSQSSSKSLSTGAVVGIVIAAIIVVIVTLIIVIRKKYYSRRRGYREVRLKGINEVSDDDSDGLY
ncbi:hypothetical protein M0811_00415 [Anaeramoeba ignava]|uniref:Fibronectin type-III domain-containing protein n=1 Tax=Anaeramoeba ignava TaxID=1746090 RepID=A0A9Q0LR00_ANAIG|nr:hypothetical protein M0811_00415 [Anaeramoeba ignava]